MGLLERVSILIRANLNELTAQAENPQDVLRQVILDMQNQLLQVKTQVAIAIAQQHQLRKQQQQLEQESFEWRRKAELAVDRGHDDTARTALTRCLSASRMAAASAEKLSHHAQDVEGLERALRALEEKLAEAQAKVHTLTLEQRRARALARAAEAGLRFDAASSESRMRTLDTREAVDRLLDEIKTGGKRPRR